LKHIRRMKTLNTIITSLLLASGIGCLALDILQLTKVYETPYDNIVIICVGLGLMIVSWIVYVVHSFIIEWAENTYALRVAYEDLRKSATQTFQPSPNVPWVSSIPSRQQLDPVSIPDISIPKSNLDMKLVQDVMNSLPDQLRTSKADSEEKVAFDQALQKLSSGVAMENEKYKIQKYRDGKIIIGTYTSGQDIKFEYLQNSKAISELHQLRWQVTDKEFDIKWK
jgi:hypothetical protein